MHRLDYLNRCWANLGQGRLVIISNASLGLTTEKKMVGKATFKIVSALKTSISYRRWKASNRKFPMCVLQV